MGGIILYQYIDEPNIHFEEQKNLNPYLLLHN